MQIAYPMRVDALDTPGGDLLQIQKYIAGGTATSPAFSGKVIVDLDADLSSFDIVHLTNMDRPAELYHFFQRACSARKPIVLSPIHHSYSEIERFERNGRPGVIGLVSGAFTFTRLEILRYFLRSVRYPVLLPPVARLLVKGTRKAQHTVLTGSHCTLTLTEKERQDLDRDIGPVLSSKVTCLRNGFDASLSSSSAGHSEQRDIDVCIVGRIEARKNQIAILKALDKLGVAGIFIGRENPNHAAYCADFKRLIAESTSQYLGGLSHTETVSYMRRSKVHVSASWFEVSSLVDIEAYYAGCRVVSSRSGGTEELLSDGARYIDPGSPAEIEAAIIAALQAAPVPAPVSPIVPCWQSVADNLATLYQALLAVN